MKRRELMKKGITFVLCLSMGLGSVPQMAFAEEAILTEEAEILDEEQVSFTEMMTDESDAGEELPELMIEEIEILPQMDAVEDEEQMTGYKVSEQSEQQGDGQAAEQSEQQGDEKTVEAAAQLDENREQMPPIEMENQEDLEAYIETELPIDENADLVTELSDTEENEALTNVEGEVLEETGDDENEELLIEVDEMVEAQLADTEAVGSISWDLTDGVLTISGSGRMEDYSSDNEPAWKASANSIKQIIIKEGITYLGDFAFDYLDNLEAVSIADTVTEAGSGVFYKCSKLKSVVLPAGFRVLSSGMFASCTSLNSLSAPGVTKIEDYALQEVTLSTMTIGKNVSEIAELAFFNAKIKEYQVEAGNTSFYSNGGVLFSDGGVTLKAFPNGSTQTTYSVPTGVTTIAAGAFIRNNNLQSVNLGNVSVLEKYCFQECSALKAINIPDSVTKVENFTFFNCGSLESVQFGNGLKKTSYRMFHKCARLKNISYGALEELNDQTFAQCYALTEIALPASITKIGVGCFGMCYELKSFSSVNLKEIPYQAFYYCTVLEDVKLNEGIESIYRESFRRCPNLKQVILPSSINYVDTDAFDDHTELVNPNPALSSYGRKGLRKIAEITFEAEQKYSAAFQVLAFVNQRRAEAGLKPLVMNDSLLNTAMKRAEEISVLFAHTRPDGSSCFALNESMYAENIAYGQGTPEAVMNSWMNSEGHRKNILTAEFKTIGIGCVVIDGSYYWTQCFGVGEDSVSCGVPEDSSSQCSVKFATERFDEAFTSPELLIVFGMNSYEYKLKAEVSVDKLAIGNSADLKLLLYNPGSKTYRKLSDAQIEWTSSDPSVAEVNGNKVTGKKAGTATLTGTLKGSAMQTEVSITVSEESETAGIDLKVPQKQLGSKNISSAVYGKALIDYYLKNGTVPIAKLKGYEFIGWYTKRSGGEKITSIKEVDEDDLLFARWEKINLKKPSMKSCSNKSRKKIRVSMKNATGVSGYEILCSRNKKFTKEKQVITSKNASATLKTKKKGTYYVKVRAYKVDSAGALVYSSYSTVKKVKVKK